MCYAVAVHIKDLYYCLTGHLTLRDVAVTWRDVVFTLAWKRAKASKQKINVISFF